MLESVNPDLVVHQGSPTKHPALRLQTIRAAGELRIPFTSGILVGIGETEEDRMAALEALAEVHAEHGHLQEVILQNFVPHRRYYGEEPAEIADDAAERVLAHRPVATRRIATLPDWATPVAIDDMKRAGRRGHGGCCPTSASRCRPTSPTGGPSSSPRARPTSAGCRANGDHISPEHPFPSPHQVRKRLAADGVALTERLCVYPQYIDPEWVAQGVLDVDQGPRTGASSRAAARGAREARVRSARTWSPVRSRGAATASA